MAKVPLSTTQQEQIIQVLKKGTPLDPKRSYADQLYTLLHLAIIRAQFLPGISLAEGTIASIVGVSRTPVREAIRKLANERLVDVYPQSGTTVSPIRLHLIREGHFIRRSLESANLQELILVITNSQIDVLHQLLDKQKLSLEHRRFDDFFELDEQMHALFFAYMHREKVWEIVRSAKAHLDRVRWLMLDEVAGTAERAFAEHQTLVSFIAARDKENLDKTLKAHIDFVFEGLIRVGELFGVPTVESA